MEAEHEAAYQQVDGNSTGGAAFVASAGDGTGAAADPSAAPANPLLEKYHESWKEVQGASHDFTLWTNLIQAAERLDDVAKLREVYDSFLASWPLCYGYWKKYADAEHRHANTEGAVSVYERGVAATPRSADLWVHYANYQKSLPEASPDAVRSIYERAAAAVGTDFLSHAMWDKYIAFEEEQGLKPNVLALYCRLLSIPLRDLEKYLQGFKATVQASALGELMSEEAAAALRAQLQQERAAAAAAAPAKPAAGSAGADAMAVDADPAAETAPGEDAPPAAEAPAAPAPAEVTDDDVKEGWMKPYLQQYESSKEEVERRKPFEDAIKRSYFHVKPLDAAQLTNWLKYLDFMEAKGDNDSTITLYERCLVACASYAEYWERYVRWLEKQQLHEYANYALQRATSVFCKPRADIHLFAARYHERQGNVEGARGRYKYVLGELSPRLLSAVTEAANFERRQGNREAACALYESLLDEEKSREEGLSKGLMPFLAMQYATFLRLAYKDHTKGREVLKGALALTPGIKALWEAAVHYEESGAAPDMLQYVMELYNKASAPPAEPVPASDPTSSTQPKGPGSPLSDKDREELSRRAIEFADMHGRAADVLAAEQRHAEQFLVPHAVAAEGRKRHADAAAAAAAAAPPAAKVARTDAGPAAAAAGATALGAVAAAAHPGAPVPPAAAPAAAGAYYGHPAPPAPPAAPAAYPPYYGGYPHYPATYPGQYPAYGHGYGY